MRLYSFAEGLLPIPAEHPDSDAERNLRLKRRLDRVAVMGACPSDLGQDTAEENPVLERFPALVAPVGPIDTELFYQHDSVARWRLQRGILVTSKHYNPC